MRDDVADEPDVQAILPTVHRSLSYPNAEGFRAAFLRTVRAVQQVTAAGVYAGQRLAYDVDLTRLNRVASRILAGLYFRETGQRLPRGYSALALAAAGFRGVDHETAETMKAVLSPVIETAAPVSIGRVFSYFMLIGPEDTGTSVCVMMFYRRVGFIGITGPDESTGCTFAT